MGEIVVCGIPFEKGEAEARKALSFVKENGFTSVQIYVYWREFEPLKRSGFQWEHYDGQVRLIQEAGLKFVPFLLMGPKYAAPDWWLKSEEHVGLKCLEHDKDNPIESVWNQKFRTEISRVVKAFAEHYNPMEVLESVQPGICGDYGEAIFPVVGNWPGDYHTHRGFWCGGEDAIADLQYSMKVKYTDIQAFNKAWRTEYQSFSEIKPFLRAHQPSRTAYMDMLLWYHNSMTEYADFWMETCRKYFPQIPVYLCTGGVEEPQHGSAFSDQARIAAKHQGGIRLTNEGNNYYENLYLTLHMYSACEFYGAYLGLEPVGPILPSGVAVRMYGSIAYGNRQVFHYYGNLLNQKGEAMAEVAEKVKNYGSFIEERKNTAGITFFWPLDEALLNGTPVPESIRDSVCAIRKSYEVNAADEQMILDGALKNSKVLIMLDTAVTRKEVLLKVAEWVKEGGVLLANCHPHDWEDAPVYEFEKVFGMKEDSEEVWGHCEYSLSPLPWTKRLASLTRQHSMIAWNKLFEDVIPIMKNKEHVQGAVTTREAYCAFLYNVGKGKGIYFAAPLDLDGKADAIWTPSPAFSYLLKDCCREFGGIEPMELEEGEEVKSVIDETEWTLMKNGEIIKRDLTRSKDSAGKEYASNPVITSIFTADPSAHVWEDGRIYIYSSHDMDPPRGCDLMDHYHVFSSEDMVNWRDEGEILSSAEVSWGRTEGGFMWAPDCAFKNGTYYFYYPHPTGEWNETWKVGVATSNSPAANFKDQGYIEGLGGFAMIDPCVFVDEDGRSYIYYGGGGRCQGGELNDDMMSLKGEMLDMEGLEDFHEATWVFKEKGIYYLTYADNNNGANQMRYAMSKNPLGPWEYKGIFLEPTGCDTTHGSVVKYKGQWYLFYHDQSLSGQGNLRTVCIDYLNFNEDGTIKTVIQTKEGVKKLVEDTSNVREKNNIRISSGTVNIYKAADAILSGNAVINVTEQEKAIVLMNGEDASIEFNQVDGVKGQRAALKIHYFTQENLAKIQLEVNGINHSLINAKYTGGLQENAGVTFFTVKLKAGKTNKIRLINTNGKILVDELEVELLDY